MEQPLGIKADAVTAWFVDTLEGVTPPLNFDQVGHGQSNLTYRVTDTDGKAWALRRPPVAGVLPTAHDMRREYRLLTALAPTSVPVPMPVGLCDDPAVTGAHFYVMSFVPGIVAPDVDRLAEALDSDALEAAGIDVADVLANLHGQDPAEVGLADLGKGTGYVHRQLQRWLGQWKKLATRDLDGVGDVHDQLVDLMPEHHEVTIVHGDYRMDNCVIDVAGRIVAVLDWELATLGDPMVDVATVLTFWHGLRDPATAVGETASPPGFPHRYQGERRYAQQSGRDLSQLPLYEAFVAWRYAMIIEGVYSRYVSGGYGEPEQGHADLLTRQVRALLDHAAERLRVG